MFFFDLCHVLKKIIFQMHTAHLYNCFFQFIVTPILGEMIQFDFHIVSTFLKLPTRRQIHSLIFADFAVSFSASLQVPWQNTYDWPTDQPTLPPQTYPAK